MGSGFRAGQIYPAHRGANPFLAMMTLIIIADGWVYVTSGAASLKRPGNVLLAFHAEGP